MLRAPVRLVGPRALELGRVRGGRVVEAHRGVAQRRRVPLLHAVAPLLGRRARVRGGLLLRVVLGREPRERGLRVAVQRALLLERGGVLLLQRGAVGAVARLGLARGLVVARVRLLELGGDEVARAGELGRALVGGGEVRAHLCVGRGKEGGDVRPAIATI